MSSKNKSKSPEPEDSVSPNKKKQVSKSNGNGNSTSEKAVAERSPEKESSKRASPFRIKPGCVVALRYRSEGNMIEISGKNHENQQIDFDNNFVQVWTDPVPGRDERLALIGKRIRCFFPNQEEKKRRVLEGEVVRLVDYENINGLKPFKVELLIDRNLMEHFTFLSRTDEDVDVSKLPNKTAKRNYQLEERIRGRNKITLLVKLQNPATMINPSKNAARWVMLKRVPPKHFYKPPSNKRKATDGNEKTAGSEEPENNPSEKNGAQSNGKRERSPTDANQTAKKRKKSNANTAGSSPANLATRHCGDGNDTADQQIANWRWLASRYFDMVLLSSLYHHSAEFDSTISTYTEHIIAGGLIGQVENIDSSANENTLAMVTIRRLILPEHTATGRLPSHGLFDAFEEFDQTAKDETIKIRIPVEHLVIVSRKCMSFDKNSTEGAGNEDILVISSAYSFRNDIYISSEAKELAMGVSEQSETSSLLDLSDSANYCHRCRRFEKDLKECPNAGECFLYSPGSRAPSWCSVCIKSLKFGIKMEQENECEENCELPCCMGLCDCHVCSSYIGSELQEELLGAVTERSKSKQNPLEFSSPFHHAASMSKFVDPVDFGLLHDFIELKSLPVPQAKPAVRVKVRKMKRPTLGRAGRSKGSKIGDKTKENESERHIDLEDYSIFKPTCARIDYDSYRQIQNKANTYYTSSSCDQIRNLRELMSKNSGSILKQMEKENEKVSAGRATRANQRRMMKDVAALGVTSASNLGLLDSLASREAQLRFDRSRIHAWGVFADEDIAADELIVEYRGELIGNAMAEKREKQYDAAKIGSDYMFRVDADNVCDATKQGNVARFINASCDPNCYTKIVPVDGSKRIVIYAKQDIAAGDELCYDYKFPLETDEKKRIPCHCGARDCRGFMNWDKRYVAIPDSVPDSRSEELQGRQNK